MEDAGHMSGLTDSELEESLATLQKMADSLEASMVVVSKSVFALLIENVQLTRRDVTRRGSLTRRTAVEVLVRKIPESQQFIELRYVSCLKFLWSHDPLEGLTSCRKLPFFLPAVSHMLEF